MALKVVLMGTGTFAVPTFQALINSEHNVAAIVTQPDRKGRGHHRHPHPVRELGELEDLPVLQPPRAGDPLFLEELRALNPDVIVVAAYGQILKRALLSIPKHGAFNLHGSLLPKHRGAAPVQYSIIKGDRRTGVTMFQIEPALDSGPIVGVRETDIQADDTSDSLMARLAEMSVPLSLDVLGQLQKGEAVFQPQDPDGVTLAPKIEKSQGRIDWSLTAQQIDCHVRGMWPWPKASAVLIRSGHPDLRCIIRRVSPCQDTGTRGPSQSIGSVTVDKSRLVVQCGDCAVEILRIQPEGSRVLDAADFIHGQNDLAGSQFESTT